MKQKRLDWIIATDGTNPDFPFWGYACTRCGVTEKMKRPIPLAEYMNKAKSFAARHAACPKLVPGTCRYCGCTEETPCAGGCAWTDKRRTICTNCHGAMRGTRRSRTNGKKSLDNEKRNQ